MSKTFKTISISLLVVIVALICSFPVLAANEEAKTGGADEPTAVVVTENVDSGENSLKVGKAIAAAAVVAIVAAAGAIGMAMAIRKSVEGMARQPEASGDIRTTLLLGLVFIETSIIYALIVAILVIFVL